LPHACNMRSCDVSHRARNQRCSGASAHRGRNVGSNQRRGRHQSRILAAAAARGRNFSWSRGTLTRRRKGFWPMQSVTGRATLWGWRRFAFASAGHALVMLPHLAAANLSAGTVRASSNPAGVLGMRDRMALETASRTLQLRSLSGTAERVVCTASGLSSVPVLRRLGRRSHCALEGSSC